MTDADRQPLLPPVPWQRFPNTKRWSAAWYVGGDPQRCLQSWIVWSEQTEAEERANAFRKLGPMPLEWIDWVACTVFPDDDPDELDMTMRKLELIGLVDFSVWSEWMLAQEA